MGQNDCIFCQIITKKKKADIVYEDAVTLVMLDHFWTTKGHLLVLSKEHVINASELPKADYSTYSKTFHTVEKALLAAVNKKRAIILKSGGFIEHFHFHIYPVDMDTPWQEIKAMFDRKTHYEYADGEKDGMLKAIQAKITELMI